MPCIMDKDNHPKPIGEILTRSLRTYDGALDEFAEFCRGNKEPQKDFKDFDFNRVYEYTIKYTLSQHFTCFKHYC